MPADAALIPHPPLPDRTRTAAGAPEPSQPAKKETGVYKCISLSLSLYIYIYIERERYREKYIDIIYTYTYREIYGEREREMEREKEGQLAQRSV